MLIKNQENSVLFEGSVVMERDGVILQAGKVEILFLPTEGTPSSAAEGTPDKREISTITADQDVRLTQGERTITSHHVIYYRKEEKMVFTGDPMVREKEDEVHGDRITIYLKEDRALIEGGEAVLHPK
jgi:lipopolysaccharide export system protein LptA